MECDLNTFSRRKAANSFGVWIFARSHRRQITPVFLCNKDLAALWGRMCCLIQVQNMEVLVEITRIKASLRQFRQRLPRISKLRTSTYPGRKKDSRQMGRRLDLRKICLGVQPGLDSFLFIPVGFYSGTGNPFWTHWFLLKADYGNFIFVFFIRWFGKDRGKKFRLLIKWQTQTVVFVLFSFQKSNIERQILSSNLRDGCMRLYLGLFKHLISRR